jgi:hypothetical protein
MRIPKFKLHRIGSDPEVLFVREVDDQFVIMPAFEVISRDKKKTTSSFIGTDSRPVLAEIRPTPARNLKRHLHELAYALTTTTEFLQNSHRWRGTSLLAYPHLLGEHVGGHIHVSMWLDDPLYLKLKARELTVGQPHVSVTARHGGEATRSRDLDPEVQHAINNNEVIGPGSWGLIMGYLLEPFEKWIQPWVPRERRNTHYGSTAHDLVRLGTSKPPFASPWAYVHWEYRLPSTWLHHPWLAYAYLGLAKLTALNMARVCALATPLPKPTPPPDDSNDDPADPPTTFTVLNVGEPEAFRAQFEMRYRQLMAGRVCVSRDLFNLERAIENCGARRREWFMIPRPLDIDAWRRLL